MFLRPLLILKWVIVFLLLSFKSFGIFCVTVLYQICLLQIFSHSLGLSFHSFDIVSHRAEAFNLNEVQLYKLFLSLIMSLIFYKKKSPYSRSSRFPPSLSFRSFILLFFTLKSVIHFHLIFVKEVRFLSGPFFFFLFNM